MKITVKVGLLFAALWILFKMGLYLAGFNSPDKLPLAILMNILGVLLSVAIGLYLTKKKETEETNALLDIKNGLASGLIYSVMVCLFIYAYYKHIDPEFNKQQIAEAQFEIKQMLDDPEALAQIQKDDSRYQVMTKDQIYADLKDNPSQMYNAGFVTTLSMLALLVLSTLYSILITVIFRKIIFR